MRRNPNAFIYKGGRMIGTEKWVKEPIYGPELLGMRLLRRKSKQEMARVIDATVSDINYIERQKDNPVLPQVVGAYMKYLNCNYNHAIQFRDIVDGKDIEFKETRHVSKHLKNKIYKKYNNKCARCESEDKLHIHHIKRYSDGGFTDLENLMLLCAKCHAEEHKDERAYYALKSMAKK